jgi:hypothetical protein
MAAICSSETSSDFQWTARRYISVDGTFHKYRCENLKSYIPLFCFLQTTGTFNITYRSIFVTGLIVPLLYENLSWFPFYRGILLQNRDREIQI